MKFVGDSSFLAFSPPKLYIYKPVQETEGTKSTEDDVYGKPQLKAEWEEVTGLATPAFGGIGPVYEAFARGKEGTWATFEDALTRHRMVEAIYRSAEMGTRESY